MGRLIYADALIHRLKTAIDLGKKIDGIVGELEAVLNDVESMPTIDAEPQWIPCSERLPRQGQEVICQCRANMIKVLKLDACGDWYQDAEHCYMSGFVIAWMPLPEPYRAKRRTDEQTKD